ncbi:LPXTG cell wall anchor domain-containing protein [Thermoflexus sp.]|uniref:LPXTG cell wall anchor domain-containing protein n=1 Tax=Thermoflexus sp. TaxID=1969742 RepID=UPI0035E41A9D
MKRIIFSLGVLWSLLLIAAAPAQETVTITLKEQNQSGQSGTAVLRAVGDQTEVTINLTPGPAGVDQPAHIHEGTCANLNPKPTFPLSPVRDGQSTSTVNVKLTDLLAKPFAINVHKSAQEVSVYVACGEITAVLPRTGGEPTTFPLWAGLLIAGGILIGAGYLLRRRLA